MLCLGTAEWYNRYEAAAKHKSGWDQTLQESFLFDRKLFTQLVMTCISKKSWFNDSSFHWTSNFTLAKDYFSTNFKGIKHNFTLQQKCNKNFTNLVILKLNSNILSHHFSMFTERNSACIIITSFLNSRTLFPLKIPTLH